MNEARFREANDAIDETARGLHLQHLIPFVCECADAACCEIVRLSTTEYLAVRTNPRHFLVIPAHGGAAGSSDVLIDEHTRYSVVRKTGAAGALAEELDRYPRGDGRI